ncbi:minor tail protein [Rhodococcus phage Shagrat]|nr:minor tail protein [Rhodococcus phage Shagrat]
MSTDGLKWWPTIEVIKYDARSTAALTRDLGHAPTGPELRELERLGLIAPDDVVVCEGNILVSVGIDRITSLIVGAGGGTLTSTTGFIGVGATNTAAAIGNTALAGDNNASTARYNGLDGGFPTRSTTTATNDTINASATFGSGIAEFVWAEWCIGMVSSGTVTPGSARASLGTTPIILNRKVDSLGTKGAGSTWTLAAKIVLS